MRVLLLSGLGPTLKGEDYLAGSLFDADADPARRSPLLSRVYGDFDLAQLHLHEGGRRTPLLRRDEEAIPHLTTFTLDSILREAGVEYDVVGLHHLWEEREPALAASYDAVLLSTSFIWERRTLSRAVAWTRDRFPAARLVLGGQYSNLKHQRIMADHPTVDAVVRGDAEDALPRLLGWLRGDVDVADVPNLVHRDAGGAVRETRMRDIDIEAHPSPGFPGHREVIPYESMRGCPFRCKFCSFPAASPIWRYKSARKIHDDWLRYRDHNGATLIKAMDSTFTVPPSRLRELQALLPIPGLRWEGFSRANSIRDPETVAALEASGCASLAIGFESMSGVSLTNMDKRVSVEQNRRCFELLKDSDIRYKVSFMAGYPGETADDFETTRRFLTEEYSGHFLLSVFSIQDETMPLWDDRERFDIRVVDEDEPDYSWSHVGMDAATARRLVRETLDEVRLRNDRAVVKLWQSRYAPPMGPGARHRRHLAVEKAVERLAMLERDHADPREAVARGNALLETLADLGVCSRADCAGDRVRPGRLEPRALSRVGA